MRRGLVVLVSVISMIGLVTTGLMAQSVPVLMSENVSLVNTFPDAGLISGSFSEVSPHYYASTLGGVRAYDVSNPRNPQLTDVLPIAQFENEAMYSGYRPNDDGTITEFVLVGNDLYAAEAPNSINHGYDPVDQAASALGSELLLIDVSDPADIYVRSRTQTKSGTHTVACMDPACLTVYTSGSTGGFSILDLTDLDAPVEVPGPSMRMTHPSPAAGGHYWDVDTAGIAWHTGRAGTAAFDISDVYNPVLLNSTNEQGTEGPWNNFIHHNSRFPGAGQFKETADVGQASWANGNILLVTEEDYENPSCDAATVSGGSGPGEGSFETWYVPSLEPGTNPDGMADNGTMQPLALYNTETLQGTVDNPAGGFCSAHWFNFHPTGVIAQGWYQEGMRLIDVRDPLAPTEFGYYYPGGSEIWDADWAPVYDDEGVSTGVLSNLLYTNDVVRGLDVLEVELPDTLLIQPDGPPDTTPPPDNPDDPGDPSEPGDPDNPDDPSDPPNDPSDPDNPDNPSDPPNDPGDPSDPPNDASEPPNDGTDQSDRLEGPTRIETAVQASQSTHPGTADTVVVARSDDYADALVGGPLAASLDAPLLLSTPNGLHPATSDEIDRLEATTVVVLGDIPAVAADLESKNGLRVDRVGSADVFATAAEVAARIPSDTVLVAEGRNDEPTRGWPDALAASAFGSSTIQPVLLVNVDSLPQATADALQGRETAIVVGGEVAVSQRVRDDINDIVGSVQVVAGQTRYETAQRMAARLDLTTDATAATMVLATGNDWADALVAGPVTASADGLLMLVDGRSLAGSPPTSEFISERARTIRHVVFMGGVAAITQQVQDDVEALQASR